MTTLEIAQKYGVPTPETSRELDWKVKTNYSWVEYKDSFVLCFESCIYKLIGVLDNANYSGYKYYKAPQIHEIAPLLPQYLQIHDATCEFTIEHDRIGYHYLEGMYKIERTSVGILPNAEDLAKLCIELKNENLL